MAAIARRPRRERVEGRGLTEISRQAFVRHLALDKYREIEDMRETLGFDGDRAAAEACTFLERGGYREIWRRHWCAVVVPAAGSATGPALLPVLEQALGAALAEEIAARQARGDRAIDEEPEYRAFVDANIERSRRDGADGLAEPG
jgi:hypothetical protein